MRLEIVMKSARTFFHLQNDEQKRFFFHNKRIENVEQMLLMMLSAANEIVIKLYYFFELYNWERQTAHNCSKNFHCRMPEKWEESIWKLNGTLGDSLFIIIFCVYFVSCLNAIMLNVIMSLMVKYWLGLLNSIYFCFGGMNLKNGDKISGSIPVF